MLIRSRSSFIGYFFAVLFGAVTGAWLLWEYKPVPNGKVIVNQSLVDSLNSYIALADSIAKLPQTDTIIKDTVYISVPEYIKVVSPEINPVDTSILEYRDTLKVKNEVDVWIKVTLQRHIDDITIEWNYKPIIRQVPVVVEKNIYHPIITPVNKDVVKYVNGHYLSAGAGGNDKFFNFGVDYDYVTRSSIYGFQYRRQGDQNIYGVKIGINLVTLFKK